jgi:hypothetical protein
MSIGMATKQYCCAGAITIGRNSQHPLGCPDAGLRGIGARTKNNDAYLKHLLKMMTHF